MNISDDRLNNRNAIFSICIQIRIGIRAWKSLASIDWKLEKKTFSAENSAKIYILLETSRYRSGRARALENLVIAIFDRWIFMPSFFSKKKIGDPYLDNDSLEYNNMYDSVRRQFR